MGEDDEMGKHASIKALEAYSYVDPETVGHLEVMNSLANESDRAVLIVCASLLEEALTEAIAAKLRKMSNTEFRDMKLFEPHGLVSGFGQKIDIAYAMEVIDRPMWRLLDHVRLIRNCCAHAFRAINLDDVPVFRTACETIFRDEWRAILPETFQQSPASLRQAIIGECTAITLVIKHGREAASATLRELMKEVHDEMRQPPPDASQNK